MTPQELKASILQLAIQGKLVEQRPDEGTGEELFRQIQADKQILTKTGKIKKEDPLPEITDEEIPFDIPESWRWVRLGECTSYLQRKEKISSEDITGDMWSLDLEDIEKESGRIVRYCAAKERKITGDKVKFFKGQILYSKLRPYLKKVLVAPADGICTSEIVPFWTYGNVDPLFLVYVLTCPHVDYVINAVTYGVKMPRVGTETMVNLLVPLPPLAEQKRIVAKIEELLPYIDRYEQAWSKLEDFNKRFPVDMQKSILQMALQGKLVEKRPEEGTGEELYQQIQAEKKRLIKAGEIKKEKPLPEIAEEEIPFEIPESWKWYRIGELFSIVNGFTPLKSNPEFWTDGDIPWFTIEDVHRQGRFINSTEKYITRKALSKNTERIVPADTVLLCCTASVGEYAFTRIPLTTNQQFNAFVVKEYCKKAVYPLYVFEYAKTLKGALIDRAGKTTFNFISVGKLSNMLIPLPPLAEQKRIVAKLEEILPLCERLK